MSQNPPLNTIAPRVNEATGHPQSFAPSEIGVPLHLFGDTQVLTALKVWLEGDDGRADSVAHLVDDQIDRQGQFLIAVLAHDLRNHLTSLRGHVDLLYRRAHREGRQSDAVELTTASYLITRMGQLIADILDAERLRQGLFTLAQTPIDLAALVIATCTLFASAECPVRTDVPSSLVAPVDGRRLQQALENLISNACTHAPPGTGVDVHLEATEIAGHACAVIEVIDRGAGIAPEFLPHVCDRYVSGGNTQGLGLGLYLAKGIAEAHGGTLTLHSEVGSGTRACLLFPLHRAASKTIELPPQNIAH